MSPKQADTDNVCRIWKNVFHGRSPPPPFGRTQAPCRHAGGGDQGPALK